MDSPAGAKRQFTPLRASISEFGSKAVPVGKLNLGDDSMWSDESTVLTASSSGGFGDLGVAERGDLAHRSMLPPARHTVYGPPEREFKFMRAFRQLAAIPVTAGGVAGRV